MKPRYIHWNPLTKQESEQWVHKGLGWVHKGFPPGKIMTTVISTFERFTLIQYMNEHYISGDVYKKTIEHFKAIIQVKRLPHFDGNSQTTARQLQVHKI